jgi:hypothetical protein
MARIGAFIQKDALDGKMSRRSLSPLSVDFAPLPDAVPIAREPIRSTKP